MPSAEFTLPELVAWGKSLGARLEPPTVYSLTGDLGAGKTTLVQAICRGYGVTEQVTSPTFSIVQEYRAPKSPVHHIDLYRIKGAGDLLNIGWDEAFGVGIAFVEWPDRAGIEMPEAHALLLEHIAGSPDKRRLTW